MTSSVLPVETVLKVEGDESLKNGDTSNKFPSGTPDFISVGTQCSAKVETKQQVSGTQLCSNPEKSIEDMKRPEKRNVESGPMFIKPWSLHMEHNRNHNQKLVMSNGFTKPYPCSLQPFSFDEDILLQLDYKTRNKLKTKQRRQDPFYRDQERMRQRAVMQLKRQDPCFRAIEREKGRCRMRIKRLDPVFRTQERERQRERMKLKRQDPNFRERERELQKNRIHEKRINLDFREREKAQDHLRMRLKHNHNNHNQLHTFARLDQNKLGTNPITVSPLEPSYISVESSKQTQNNRNLSLCSSDHYGDVKPIILKDGENAVDSFHHRTSHVFNLHVYNDGTDAWQNSAEKISKAALLFNMFKEDNRQSSLSAPVSNCGNVCTARVRSDYIGHETKNHVNNSVVTSETGKQQLCLMGVDSSSVAEPSRKISERHLVLPPPSDS